MAIGKENTYLMMDGEPVSGMGTALAVGGDHFHQSEQTLVEGRGGENMVC